MSSETGSDDFVLFLGVVENLMKLNFAIKLQNNVCARSKIAVPSNVSGLHGNRSSFGREKNRMGFIFYEIIFYS